MKLLIISFLMLISSSILGQTTRKIVKDFDGDSKKDTVRIDSDTRTLICLLSTQKLATMELEVKEEPGEEKTIKNKETKKKRRWYHFF